MYKIKFLNGTGREFETLAGADLSGANLRYANLRGADLSGADLGDAKGLPDLSVPNLLNEIPTTPDKLDMGSWHCGTAHCLAGWAVHLAGPEGYKLEAQIGPSAAGALIWSASCGIIPNFLDSNEDAIIWLEEQRAARVAEKGGTPS